MARRLNDTRALTDAPSRGGTRHSISSRKIDNGYLVEECTVTDTGEYQERCSYSATEPKLVPGRVSGARKVGPDIAGGNGLGDAVKYLGN